MLNGSLYYGVGLRLVKRVRQRVKDVELASNELIVREAKAGKVYMTLLSANLIGRLQRYRRKAKAQQRVWRMAIAQCICPFRWLVNIQCRAGAGLGIRVSLAEFVF